MYVLSLHFTIPECGSVDEVLSSLPSKLRSDCTTCVAFLHPLREKTIRVMCILPVVPSAITLAELAAAQPLPLRGEIHVSQPTASIVAVTDNEKIVDELRSVLQSVGLGEVILVNQSPFVGYALHEKAAQLMCKQLL